MNLLHCCTWVVDGHAEWSQWHWTRALWKTCAETDNSVTSKRRGGQSSLARWRKEPLLQFCLSAKGKQHCKKSNQFFSVIMFSKLLIAETVTDNNNITLTQCSLTAKNLLCQPPGACLKQRWGNFTLFYFTSTFQTCNHKNDDSSDIPLGNLSVFVLPKGFTVDSRYIALKQQWTFSEIVQCLGTTGSSSSKYTGNACNNCKSAHRENTVATATCAMLLCLCKILFLNIVWDKLVAVWPCI